MIWVVVKLKKNDWQFNYSVGKFSIIIGSSYGTLMACRLFIGLAKLTSIEWFNKPIPAFFHLVLASWLLIFGYVNVAKASNTEFRISDLKLLLSWIVYPCSIVSGYYIYAELLPLLGPTFSAYLVAMIFGLIVVTAFELIIPYKQEWFPTKADIKTDLIYMVVVQVLLPYFLSLVSLIGIEWVCRTKNFQVAIWPRELPLLLQVVLIILAADFFRYWLHRTAHTWRPLWRFHAVHHSVEKLYWLNVGRFHPFEKTLQFLFESFPFILLGASQEVLSAYFIFYAINGFFQHSNVDVRLGWLNYIISGPELHRWHHSREIHESNSNYGNNVIIWDILFGSFLFPRERSVDYLGLQYKSFPSGVLDQIKAPFFDEYYQR
ncbi:MAG: sterol desaturase family protein [Deltaproteobacteria bacterium]|nr:sterol desaturase family protein [Deltaproteobacteria bacterium]